MTMATDKVTAAMRDGASLYRPNWRDHGELVSVDPENPKRLLVRRVAATTMRQLIAAGSITVTERQVGRDKFALAADSGI